MAAEAFPDDNWKDKTVVAAIDIGTTYSGYAYSTITNYQKSPADVTANSLWKSGGSLKTSKTPTCLLLTPNGELSNFGYAAETEFAKLSQTEEGKDYYFFKHFKMELYETQKLDRTLQLLDARGKSLPALRVFTCSIKYLKDHLWSTVSKQITGLEFDDIFWVLTVPAIWSESAKQFMREAAEQAGLKSDHLRLALEPECAAIWCQTVPLQKSGGSIEVMLPGSVYMVLDMGGGTLDVTVHKITETSALKELYRASGGPWGGNNVNRAFQDFIIKIVGAPVWEKFSREKMKDYLFFSRSFEEQKCALEEEPGEVPVRAPSSLFKIQQKELGEDFNKSVRDTRFHKEVEKSDDEIVINYATFLQEFFQGTVDHLIEHINQILEDVVEPVNTFLLVGGFADCSFVEGSIRKCFQDKTIVIPEEANLAIVKGGVLFGRDPEIISSRVCRFTYGFEWSEAFVPGVHPDDKKELTDDGCYCKDVFKVLVERDQIVYAGQKTKGETVFVKYEYQDKIEFPFYKSTERTPHFVTDESCTHIGTLDMKVPLSNEGLDRSVSISWRFGGTEIKAIVTDPKTGKFRIARFDLLLNS